jgi:hypothetical protein
VKDKRKRLQMNAKYGCRVRFECQCIANCNVFESPNNFIIVKKHTPGLIKTDKKIIHKWLDGRHN